MNVNLFEIESEYRGQKEVLERRMREIEIYNLYSEQTKAREKYQITFFGLKLSL
jgi:hypothetical protein